MNVLIFSFFSFRGLSTNYNSSSILFVILYDINLLIYRLNDDAYTLDEVEEMIDGLQKVVCSSVETELINDAHTNVLLLVQLFSQAEKWHLKLQSDISELENQ